MGWVVPGYLMYRPTRVGAEGNVTGLEAAVAAAAKTVVQRAGREKNSRNWPNGISRSPGSTYVPRARDGTANKSKHRAPVFRA
jgi:hypothetical protein